jgi:RNA polymerase II subunit A small phosphatase-like protein
LDLDETLVHSSFRPVANADFVLKIEIDGHFYEVFVLKRPGCDEFLEAVSKWYEIVIFTASLPQYANPLLDRLDKNNVVEGRLFREHCTRQGPIYVKDLGKIGRRLPHTILVDNSPNSWVLHPEYSIPIVTWFEDPNDRELYDLVGVLEKLTKFDDVSEVLNADLPWKTTVKNINSKYKELFE